MPAKKQYTLADLRKLAKKYNLEVDTSSIGVYGLYTPNGYKFNMEGNHCRIEPHHGIADYKKDAINDLMDFLLGYEKYKMPVLEKCKKGCDCGWDE